MGFFGSKMMRRSVSSKTTWKKVVLEYTLHVEGHGFPFFVEACFLNHSQITGKKTSVLRSKSYLCILQVHRNAIRYVHPYDHTTGKQKIKATGKDWQKRSGKDPAKLGLHIFGGFLVWKNILYTLPETNSSTLKIDPWNLGDSFWKTTIS